MNRKRVLFVSPVAELGGAEQVLIATAKRVKDYGFDVFAVMLRPGPLVKIFQDEGIETYYFESDFRYRDIISVLNCVTWLLKLVKKLKIDILHVNHSGHLITGFVRFFSKAKEIWHIYDYPYKKDIVDILMRKISADYVIFATNKVESGYCDLHGIGHSVVNPDCIDFKSEKYLQIFEGDITSIYNIPSSGFLLMVARLQSHKGHTYLIEAMRDIVAQRPDLHCVIVGKAGDKKQEEYLETLKCEVIDSGMMNNIYFTGFISDDVLNYLRKNASILVHPALSEGYGLVLMEAMLFGLPVVVADADGPSEIIQSGVNGLLVPKKDSSALSSAILKLLEDEELRKKIVEGGLESLDKHNVDVMIEKTVDVYRQVLGLR